MPFLFPTPGGGVNPTNYSALSVGNIAYPRPVADGLLPGIVGCPAAAMYPWELSELEGTVGDYFMDGVSIASAGAIALAETDMPDVVSNFAPDGELVARIAVVTISATGDAVVAFQVEDGNGLIRTWTVTFVNTEATSFESPWPIRRFISASVTTEIARTIDVGFTDKIRLPLPVQHKIGVTMGEGPIGTILVADTDYTVTPGDPADADKDAFGYIEIDNADGAEDFLFYIVPAPQYSSAIGGTTYPGA